MRWIPRRALSMWWTSIVKNSGPRVWNVPDAPVEPTIHGAASAIRLSFEKYVRQSSAVVYFVKIQRGICHCSLYVLSYSIYVGIFWNSALPTLCVTTSRERAAFLRLPETFSNIRLRVFRLFSEVLSDRRSLFAHSFQIYREEQQKRLK